MSTVEPGEDYRSTLKGHLDYHKQAGNEPGDPAKAAQAIIAIANDANPPLRLLLGKDAVLIARSVDQARLAETDRWEQLSSWTCSLFGGDSNVEVESVEIHQKR